MSTIAANVFLGTGRRKTSTARVRLTEGSGKVVVNDRDAEEYFSPPTKPENDMYSFFSSFLPVSSTFSALMMMT